VKHTTLLSESPPDNTKKIQQSFAASMEELRDHIEELQRVLGCPIKYSPTTKFYNPLQCALLLKIQMPGVINSRSS
jgi:hypothetical protein